MKDMYECSNCHKQFERPIFEKVCQEDYYGVGGLFGNKHYSVVGFCPYCKSEEWEKVKENDDEFIQ